MSYRIFKQADGKCLAIEESALDNTIICDELGELTFDSPMPVIIAKMHAAKRGGKLLHGDQSAPKSMESHLESMTREIMSSPTPDELRLMD